MKEKEEEMGNEEKQEDGGRESKGKIFSKNEYLNLSYTLKTKKFYKRRDNEESILPGIKIYCKTILIKAGDTEIDK